MRRIAQAILLVWAIDGLEPAYADRTTVCFTMRFDWRTQIDESYEQHNVEADYRPSGYGDHSGVFQASDRDDCDIHGLAPGQVKKFRLAWLRGSAIGVNKPFTATARTNGPPPPGDDTFVTLTRKREGATMEFGVEAVPGRGESEFGLCYPSWQPRQVQLTEQEVRDFARLRKTVSLTLSEDACSGKGVMTLGAAREIEVSVEPPLDYESWLPKADLEEVEKPGARLAVKISVHEKGDPETAARAKIDFALIKVSKEKGAAVNWPANAAPDYDLRLLEEENPDLEVVGPDRATTRDLVSEERVVVTSHDFAAWGVLRISATDASGRDVPVKVRGRDTPDLAIPFDENDNHIADAWELQALGHLRGSRNLDDERVEGQIAVGDGIVLHDEYRGVVVLDEGRRVHKRLDPRTKELFVIDPGKDFPTALWKRLSKLTTIRVAESLVGPPMIEDGAPVVNFNSGYSKGSPFFAVRIHSMAGVEDPDPWPGAPEIQINESYPLMAYWAGMDPGGIKRTTYVKVFPGRVRSFVDEKMKWLRKGLSDHASEEGEELRLPWNGFSVEEAARALTILETPEGYQMVVRKILNLLFLHEVAHACGELIDHTDDAPDDQVRSCLMFNPGDTGKRRLVVQTALGRGDPDLAYPRTGFCDLGGDSTYRCAAKLTVKDW